MPSEKPLKLEIKPKEEARNVTTKSSNLEYGCIPLELISDLSIEKHWKIKLKSLNEIEIILQEQANLNLLANQMQGFVNLMLKVSRDTNNNVVVQTLKMIN